MECCDIKKEKEKDGKIYCINLFVYHRWVWCFVFVRQIGLFVGPLLYWVGFRREVFPPKTLSLLKVVLKKEERHHLFMGLVAHKRNVECGWVNSFTGLSNDGWRAHLGSYRNRVVLMLLKRIFIIRWYSLSELFHEKSWCLLISLVGWGASTIEEFKHQFQIRRCSLLRLSLNVKFGFKFIIFFFFLIYSVQVKTEDW